VTNPEPIHEASESLAQLSGLVGELSQHTSKLRAEIAAFSFLTMVQSSLADSPRDLITDLGGVRRLRRAAADLYERVIADPLLAEYFEETSTIQIRQRQVDLFLTMFGVKDHHGKPLESLHFNLGISDEAFERLLYHVREVLGQLDLDNDERDAAVKQLRLLKEEIGE
jgi:hemoglobin